MRKDIERYCNGCKILVPPFVSTCPKCDRDYGLSYFPGLSTDYFSFFSFTKEGGRAVNICEVRGNLNQKQLIEPYLDRCDYEGSYNGYIVKEPYDGKIVYMTPLATVKEQEKSKSGCLIFIGLINAATYLALILGTM